VGSPDQYEDLRRGVREVCAEFPDGYWRELDVRREYPEAFIEAMTKSGYLGARVIKVERPEVGDFAREYDRTLKGLASHFVWLNRSKESLTLDLKQDGAKEVLARIIERADVFVQNLAPGATGRRQILRERHPSLIVCDISGYGSSGPYRDKKAYDLLVQCEAGLVSITGTPETPSKVGVSIADIVLREHADWRLLRKSGRAKGALRIPRLSGVLGGDHQAASPTMCPTPKCIRCWGQLSSSSTLDPARS
jgi:hypothetical protein